MRIKLRVGWLGVLILAVIGFAFFPAIPTYAACPADMASFWRLNEAAGPSYVDAFGKNDGAGSANPTATTDGVVDGDGAQHFDGIGQGITVPGSHTFGWLGSESFSIELWVKTDDATPPGGNQALIGRRDSDTDMQWWIGLEGGTGDAIVVLRDRPSEENNTTILIGADNSLSTGEWHHVVVTRNGVTNDNELWVDGTLQASEERAFGLGFSSATPLYIGNLRDALYFKGTIDEVALYDRALGVDEILAHRDAGREGIGVAGLRPAPVANAGPNQTGVKASSEVALDGRGSTPGYPEAPIEQYLWELLTAGPSGTLNGATSATPTFLIDAPGDVGAAGVTLTFQLTVTAQDKQQHIDTVTVGLVALIEPMADAGPGQTVAIDETVTLDASGSSDADGDIVKYAWVQTGGPSPVTLSDVAVVNPTFTAPQVDAAETFTFELTVTDDDGLTATDTVDVIVDPAGTPTPAPAGGGGGGGCFINSLF